MGDSVILAVAMFGMGLLIGFVFGAIAVSWVVLWLTEDSIRKRVPEEAQKRPAEVDANPG